MLSNKTDSKNRWSRKQLSISVISLLIFLLSIAQPGNTKEQKTSSNRLPPAPDTGAPEEDFAAGGTRDNRRRDSLCGADRQQVAYLLGNKNREYTLSAYPTFWFHIPQTIDRTAKVNFVVTELETGKRKFARTIEAVGGSSIAGINLPQEKQYALSSGVNYAWSLEVDCAKQNKEIALEGWITRVSSPSKLQNQLAAVPEAEKHQVYLNHNLLYDALTQLAKRRMAKPHNVQVETAWNQLLIELGWQDLIQQKSTRELSITNLQICKENRYTYLQK